MSNPLRVGFVRHAAMIGGTQVLQAATAMLAGVLVARLLGPSANGTLSVLTALASMAVLVASLGVHFSGVYFLGRFAGERDAIIANNLAVGMVGGLVTGGVLVVAALLFRHLLLNNIPLETFLAFALFVPCYYFNQFARRIALGMGRIGVYLAPDLVGGIGLLAGTGLVLVVLGRQLLALVVVRVILEAFVTAFLLVYSLRLVSRRVRPSRAVLRRQLAYGIRNYAGSLLWLFLLQSDLILCNDFLGSGPTGVYSIAVSLGLPVTILASVLGPLMFQRVSADSDRPNRIANTNRVLRILIPLAGVVAVAAAVMSHWAIPLIYGDRFAGASSALLILLPGLLALTLCTTLMSFLGGEGSPPIVYRAPLVGLVLNVVVNVVVVPRYGIDGAAATSSACYAIVLALVLRHYVRSTDSLPRDMLLLRASDLRALRPARVPVAEPQAAGIGLT